MTRRLLALVFSLAAGWSCAYGQTASTSDLTKTKTQAFLGIHLEAIPEVLYDHLPTIQRGLGVLVEQVKLNSAAEKAGLKRHDLILSCNGTILKSSSHLASLVRSGKADRKAALVLIRKGKEVTLDVNLVEAFKLDETNATADLRGAAKHGRPPAVTVKATKIGADKMEVTFTFVPEGKTKERQVICSGTLDQIEKQAEELPMPVQDLARVALNRLRGSKSR
jgi:membrane-associated protease RseP (regulator of RpoE activity)